MPSYAIQEQNQEMVSLLSAYFRLLYNPIHAMSDAISMLQMFPDIVGIWPGSVAGGGSANNNMLVDISGNALHLTKNGGTTFNISNLIPYVNYNGTTAYYSHADATIFDIVGNESYIGGTVQGLTIGGWFYIENISPGSSEHMIGKGASAYLLQHDTSNQFRFRVYDGATAYAVGTTTATVNNWYFVCGRYDPSTAVSIKVNSAAFEDNTTSIPSSLNNSADGFAIGASAAGASFFDGRSCFNFLTASFVPNQFIDAYYQMTAPLFGVSV